MNLRDKIIQEMYNLVNDNNLCKDMQKGFVDLDKYIISILPGGNRDERMDEGENLICELERAAFCAGANMVLDFIAGKEAT